MFILLTLDLPHANQSLRQKSLTFNKSLKQASLSSESSLHQHHSLSGTLRTNMFLMHIVLLLSATPLMYNNISRQLRSQAKQSLRYSVNEPYKHLSSYYLAHQTLRHHNSAKPNSQASYSNSQGSALRPQTIRYHTIIKNMTANTLCYSGN